MVCGSYPGQVVGLFLSALVGGRAGFEAEAVIAGFHDVAVVGEAVEHGAHLSVAEHVSPFAEAQVRGDDHRGPFVKLAQQLKSSAPPEGLNGT